MADLLEFLDSVSIDVVKRKYYNANKVNAVFEELREHAAALMQENEQLRHALNTRLKRWNRCRQLIVRLSAQLMHVPMKCLIPRQRKAARCERKRSSVLRMPRGRLRNV